MIEIGDIVNCTKIFVPYINPRALNHMLVIDDCNYPEVAVKLNDAVGSYYKFDIDDLKIVLKGNNKVNIENTSLRNKIVLCKKHEGSSCWIFGIFIKAVMVDNKIMYKIKIRQNEKGIPLCHSEIELFEFYKTL